MAISKIQLGNGTAQEIRDANSLHYIGHVDSGITLENNTYTSGTALTIGGRSVTIAKYDYVTFSNDNINLVCTDTDGATEGKECTWSKLTEKAAEIPVQDVKIGETSIVTNNIATIPAATDSSLGLVQAGSNIDINSGVISVADASTSDKGVVKLSTVIPASGADNTTVPTTLAVKNAIDALPAPMVFKGTVGDAAATPTVTWDNLPGAAGETVGYTYKVLTKHTTAPICEVGDTIICAETSSAQYGWVVIPSGDEPDGTITSIVASAGANSNLTVAMSDSGTGSTVDITTGGTITVDVAANHTIPDDTSISHWDAAYTKVTPYTENTNIVNGLATAATQDSGDGSVLIARVGGTDNDTLFIDYIKPTIDSSGKAVVKPNS